MARLVPNTFMMLFAIVACLLSVQGSMAALTGIPVITPGLRSYMAGTSTAMPAPVARMFDTYRAAASMSQGQTVSASTPGGPGGGPGTGPPPIQDPAKAAVDAAVLGVISQALNTASGIVYTVSGALATTASLISIELGEIGTLSDRASLALSIDSFGSTIYSDFNAQIDDSDYIGLAAKYVKMWSDLRSRLGTAGELSGNVQDQMTQLVGAQDLLKSVVSRSTGNETA